MTDPLARLRAALDRDETVARAAIGDRTATRWVADDDDVWGVEGDLSGPHRCDQHPAGRPNACNDDPIASAEDVSDRLAPARAAHIARQSPYATLLRAEAIRKALRLHGEAERDSVLSDRDAGFEAGVYAALEILASICTEELA